MGLKQQLGRAAMNRISAMPSVKAATERGEGERLAPAIQAATEIAYSAVDDEAARDELRSRKAFVVSFSFGRRPT
jgi:hypothetical protein